MDSTKIRPCFDPVLSLLSFITTIQNWCTNPKGLSRGLDAAQKGRETLSYWEGKNEHREEELARLEDELKEIDAAQIKLGEDDELRETVRRLSNQDKVRRP